MGNLLQDPGWELAGAAWTYEENAGTNDQGPRNGLANGYVYSAREFLGVNPQTGQPIWGFPENGSISQVVTTEAGKYYKVEAWVRLSTPGAAIELACENGGGDPAVLHRLDSPEGTGEWQHLTGLVKAVGTSLTWVLRTVWTGTAGQMGYWFADDAVLSPAWPEEDVAAGTLEAFLANLAALIGTADPNIGRVFPQQPRWRSPQEIADAAAFQVARGGVLDTFDRVGKRVLRFWTLEAKTDASPLTNGTRELQHAVTVHGFFQWEQGDSQEEALRRAAALLVERISLAEWTSLETGPGFEGFLGIPPAMSSSVQTARIGESEIQGHSVDLVVTYFEEVSN